MRIQAKNIDGRLVALLSENLDISTVAQGRVDLLELLGSDGPICLDFSDLTEIDTAGAQLVLALRKEADKSRKDCRFVHPSEVVADVFKVFGRSNVFDEAVIRN